MLIHQNHDAGEENGSIMVGMFVCLCLASKKPSEREFFVPAGTDLGVKLLSAADMIKQASFILAVAAAVSLSAHAMELTTNNFHEMTDDKTMFIKFFAP